jgi:carboxyl-terminal processing protease
MIKILLICLFSYNLTIADLLLDSVTETKSLVQKNYLNAKSDKDLAENAMQGILSLDPYSMYLNPEEYKEMMESLSGHLIGIGVEMQKLTSDSFATIITPLDGSPAMEVGILPNDLIIEIDGQSIANLNIIQLSKKIRGNEGEFVKLKIARNGKEIFEVKIQRRKISLNSVHSATIDYNDKKIGYVKIRSFSEDTAKQFELAIKKLNKNKTCNLILDLRNNPGGLLDQSINVASVFLYADQIVTKIMGRDNVLLEKIYPNHSEFIKLCGDVIVLINEGSASASEILAASLNDNDRAILIGRKSFGKGLIQTIFPLQSIEGSAAKFTIAEYLSPKGTKINKIGIEPDIKISDEEIKEYILLKEKEKPSDGKIDLKKRNEIDLQDPYIKAALKILKIKK